MVAPQPADLPTGDGRAAGILALAAVLGALAIALAAASLLDPHLVLRFAPTGESAVSPGAVTQALLLDLPRRLRSAAALVALLAALVVAVRHGLRDLLVCGGQETPTLLRDALGRVPRLDRLVLACLCAIALAVRLRYLGQPIRYDEALTYNEFASRSLAYMASYYPEPNNQVLHTLLVAVSAHLLGSAPWALRVPALVAGLLLVPATYVLGRVLFDRWSALLGSAAVAGSSYLVEFSTLARGYTLQALCFVLALAVVAGTTRRWRRAGLLLAGLCVWLGFWTIPTMLYGAAIVGVWLLARPPRPWSLLAAAAVLAGGLTLLAYLPVWLVSGPQALLGNRFVTPLAPADLAAQLGPSLLRTWGFWQRDLPTVVGLLLAAMALLACVRVRDRVGVPIGPLAVAVSLLLVLAQRVAPFERVWLFLLPLFYLLAARGAEVVVRLAGQRAPRWPVAATALVSVLLASGMALSVAMSGSVLASDEVGAYPDAAAATQALRSRLKADDAVLSLVPASLPELQYDFQRAGLDAGQLVRPPSGGQLYVLVVPGDDTSERLDPLLRKAGIDPGRWSQPRPVTAFTDSELLVLVPASAATAPGLRYSPV